MLIRIIVAALFVIIKPSIETEGLHFVDRERKPFTFCFAESEFILIAPATVLF